MGTIVPLIPPDNTSVVSLITMKDELGVSGSDFDVLIQSKLTNAERRVASILGGRDQTYLFRGRYRETFQSNWRVHKQLSVKPLAAIHAVTLDGIAQDVSDFSVGDRKLGTLHSVIGFSSEGRVIGDAPASWLHSQGRRVDIDPNAWRADYTAGWFVADDNVLAAQISVSDADNSYNGTAFPTHLMPGDMISAGSFANAENNGLKVVESATTTKIVVTPETPLVTESVGSRAIYVEAIPAEIVEAIKLLTRAGFHATSRDPSIASEKVGPLSVSYRTDASALQSADQEAQSILAGLMPSRATHYGVVRA